MSLRNGRPFRTFDIRTFSMHVGVCTIRFQVSGSASLKEKRHVVQSIKDRTRQRFNVAIAEVGELEHHSLAELGVACVSNDARHANSMLTNVVNFVEGEFPISVLDVQAELL